MTSSFLAIIWAFVAFVVLRQVAKRYFHEPNRATVASAAVAVTFLATYFSNTDVGTVAAPVAPTAAPAVAAANAPVPTIRNDSASCKIPNPPVVPGGVGSIDVARSDAQQVHDGGSVEANKNIILAGWAIDKDKTQVAAAVCMIVDGKLEPRASSIYGTTRADVAATYRVDSVAPAGFALELPASALSAGTHEFGVAVQSSDGTWQSLAHPISLQLT